MSDNVNKEKEIAETEQSKEEKRHELFIRQKELLDTFLSHKAITQVQYDKSLNDMKKKMVYEE